MFGDDKNQKPKRIYGMSKKIYNDKIQPSKLYKWRNELELEGYFKQVEDDKWLSSPLPLIDEIEKKTLKHFSEKQKEVLTKFIDTIFRESVSQVNQDVTEDFNAIDILSSDFDLFLILYSATIRGQKNRLLHPRTMLEYDSWLKRLDAAEVKRVKDILYKSGMTPFEISQHKSYDLFIPMDLVEEIKGFTSIGKKYQVFTLQIEDLNRRLDQALKFIPGIKKGFRPTR